MNGPGARGLGLVVVLLASLAASAAADFRDGTVIPVAGRLVDASGDPVADATVVLEVSRRSFSLRRLGKVQGKPLRLPTQTDADGRFRIDWRWDRHYNVFDLAVGAEVRREGQPDYEVLYRQSVTDAVTAGQAGDLTVAVAEIGYLRWLQRYLDGQASDEEERLYREMGRPERLEESDERPGETSWWYFEQGKVYRFRDGRLEQVTPFEPVQPLG